MTSRLLRGAAVLCGCWALSCSTLGDVPLREATTASSKLGAQRLDERELMALEAGRRVSHDSVFWHDGGKYIAGVSYAVVRAKPDRLLEVASNVESMRSWLPFNQRTEIVARDGDTLIVEMDQGFEPLVASYALRVRVGESAVRWELDHDRPHDIADTWGFVSFRPYAGEHALMVVGLALDLGDGMVRTVLEKEVHRMMLWVIDDARDYFEGQVARDMPSILCPPGESRKLSTQAP